MQIIISPAKKMRSDDDTPGYQGLPFCLEKTAQIMEVMKSMSEKQLMSLYKCSPAIAHLNHERLEHMDLKKSLIPAIFAYDGIQYQYMSSRVLTEDNYRYLQDHLYIVSGFYGLLRPFDGITPYRLEMGTRLKVGQSKDLYAFWHDEINSRLEQSGGKVLVLASQEYAKAVDRDRFKAVTVSFMEMHNGKLMDKGTFSKMARGMMVRYLAQNEITDFEGVKGFTDADYSFDAGLSDDRSFVFVRR